MIVKPQQAVSHSATGGRAVERWKVHKLIPSTAIVFIFVCIFAMCRSVDSILSPEVNITRDTLQNAHKMKKKKTIVSHGNIFLIFIAISNAYNI